MVARRQDPTSTVHPTHPPPIFEQNATNAFLQNHLYLQQDKETKSIFQKQDHHLPIPNDSSHLIQIEAAFT